MKVTTKVKCQCGFKTELTFRKPGIMNPTLERFTCSGCETEYLARFERPKDKVALEKNQLMISLKFLQISETLRGILEEEHAGRISVPEPEV